MRRALVPQEYDYTVMNIPGKDNAVADYLSRLVVDCENCQFVPCLKFVVRSNYVKLVISFFFVCVLYFPLDNIRNKGEV